MTRDEAIEKAKKLLRLATSDNPHEAALAAQRAQEILARYELTSALLDEGADEEIEDFGDKDAPLDTCAGKQLATWKNYLSAVVARANGCKTYVRWEWDGQKQKHCATLHIIGRPSDAEAIRYLYQFVVREIERLVVRDGKGCGKTWRNQYRLGVVDTVKHRLAKAKEVTVHAMRTEYQSNPLALVKLDRAVAKVENKVAEVEAWVQKHKELRNRQAHRVNYDHGARERGRRAGKEITLHPAKGTLESARRMITN